MKPLYLQLYSLRDLPDYREVAKLTAGMGYDGVELAGGYEVVPAAERRALYDKLGLECIGAHTGLADVEAEIAYIKAMGGKYLVLPYAEMKTREQVMAIAAKLNNAAKLAAKHGITVGYHNHHHEFEKVDGEYILDILLANTDKSVFCQLDVFWVAYAGLDVYEYMKKQSGRVGMIHIKEISKDGKRENVVVGEGAFDWHRLVNEARAAGAKEFIVEQEEYPIPPIESCAKDYEFLSTIV